MHDSPFWCRFEQAPLIGIVRSMSMDDFTRILPLFEAAGLNTIEVTMNTPGCADMIRYAAETYANTLNVGAGTVCKPEDLKQALAAGAQFVVTPVVSGTVISACKKRAIPVFAGAFTPTEIYQAWTLGASMVKVYPAATVGPDFIRHIKAPFRQIKLLPTGGITLANMSDFLKAGASGIGVGAPLFLPKSIAAGDWTGLRAHFDQFANELRTAETTV